MAAADAAFAEGTPCWADAMLSDLEAGKRFYGELFGWTYGDPAPPERGSYTEAYLDGRPAAALAYKRDGRLPTSWTVYLATPDAAATTARVRAAGGQVVTEPVRAGDLATVATAVDPGGALFGLWQPGTLSGFGVRHTPGSYVWAEVHTRRGEAVDAFYAEVFRYGMHPLGGGARARGRERTGGEARGPEEPGERAGPGREGSQRGSERRGNGPDDFMVWTPPGEPADDEHAVGGRSVLEAAYPAEMPAHFLLHFAVADCDAAVRATGRLGGRTVHGPQDTPFGRSAVLVDNQGARFAVLGSPPAGRPGAPPSG